MSIASVNTRAQFGMQALPIAVEVHISNGLPAFVIVGLPETVVKESKERVRSAILNSQFELPDGRITVNLAPADIPKEGGRFDLPIAIGILVASGQIKGHMLHEYEFAGELALNGALRPIHASLPFSYACYQAHRKLVLPYKSCIDAAFIQKTELYASQNLLEVCSHLSGQKPMQSWVRHPPPLASPPPQLDFADVMGQTQAKRALIIAASGGHHLLMQGPPGTGKTMLASRLSGILPLLTESQAIELACLYSIRGTPFANEGREKRPFRSPHHTSSAIALVGGGSNPKPGEISLAHQGILFLDELPEFDQKVLEVLREPLESGVIHISRAKDQVSFPAQFQLIAAMNPCPCGYLGSSSKNCRCKPEQIQRYQGKLSGPLLDRIDLHLQVEEVPYRILTQKPLYPPENSAQIQKRVQACQTLQIKRQGCLNAALKGKALDIHCYLGPAENAILASAAHTLQLSARAIHRLLRVTRSIADLDLSHNIQVKHLSEALAYRHSTNNSH